MQTIERVEKWKQKLLDLGKRNRLLNFKETKRSTVNINRPSISELFDLIVNQNKEIEFMLVDPKKNMLNYDSEEDEPRFVEKKQIVLKQGQVLTNKTDNDLLKSLYQLRAKAKTAMEEQGVNILFLAFGFLEWTESPSSNVTMKSPILLVPVQLNLESIVEPYKIVMRDDDIVINPTLQFKLENDFGINIPSITAEEFDVEIFLNEVEELITSNGWKVSKEVQLSLFSFLKLNMYKDIEKFAQEIATHPIIKAISGDVSEIKPVPEDILNGLDFDNQIRPIDTFQVIDADSSQQEAVVSAKRGVSFVLQGPPGTGKSQTITNIIAECLASGKKVLFVSEKMAALEVVYRRLNEVGLTDFCLQLHSHKANKKDVISELGKTIMLPKSQVADGALDMLSQLCDNREKLNKYVNAIHTECEPLKKSIYQIHGRLLKYQNAPDLRFGFKEAGDKNASDIRKYERALEQFANTAAKMGDDYSSNPWEGCGIDTFTLELQHDITTRFNRLLSLIDSLNIKIAEVEKTYLIRNYSSLSLIHRLREILEIARLSPMPPNSWFKKDIIAPFLDKANSYKCLTEEYSSIKHELDSLYMDEIYKMDENSLITDLKINIEGVIQLLNSGLIRVVEDLLTNRDKLIKTLSQAFDYTTKIIDLCSKITHIIGVEEVSNMNDVKKLTLLCELISKDPKPLDAWFDVKELLVIKELFIQSRERYVKIKDNEKILLEIFDKEIMNVDYNSLLKKFRVDYSSVLRIIKPSYYKDKKEIRYLMKNQGVKLTLDKTVYYLQLLKEINESKEWITSNEKTMQDSFGSWFNNELTQWDDLHNAISNLEKIIAYFENSSIPMTLKGLLITSGKGIIQHNEIYYEISNMRNMHGIFISNVHEVLNSTLFEEIENTPLLRLKQIPNKAFEHLSLLYTAYDNISGLFHPSSSRGLTEVIDDLEKLQKLHIFEDDISSKSKQLKDEFGTFFEGVDTHWDEIIDSLHWTYKMMECFLPLEIPESFVKVICSSSKAIDKAGELSDVIAEILKLIAVEVAFIEGLFDEQKRNLQDRDIIELHKWLVRCLNNFRDLEDWIDFRSSRQECIELGLLSFINEVIENNINSKDVVNAFFKRFYRLWLDNMYSRFPEIQSFRRIKHEDRIKEFQTLDKNQFKIAQTRIREYLSSKRPNPNSIAARGSEVSILLRETEKRRKIMPLRKLFQSIPNLLLTIKPCLLMSPLSVSLYLDPDNFKFDVIVFDEASQICSEDAIGAIFRAEQVIVVGDREQLPPTNFFSTSTGESDFEEESDDDDTEAYESILDECSKALHKMSLLWHYRSRHEHLIAFSNAKIYKNLVTFPSPTDRVPNFGVEYIEVSDGIYDRSVSRSNKVEAQRVAMLVFEHFKKFPQRSLGVVAFSEAQQTAIDYAIRQIRSVDLSYETFFNEEKEEPFFVKNLENVQGDERDTIIFSIGYAKDQSGVMHMNFGPLSKQGGYRRLNVAITRAKYNVKLVGSIKPTDIDLERTSSDGVKMLRHYIEFAIHGPEALERELCVPSFIEFDSPFEEEVYRMLTEKGYKVDTQVGCSGYRIDLAVRHPEKFGYYVLGVECDGATYHSARTARERDRLREDVLRMRGWRLHRIWSTDWIKDPVFEMNKLIHAIEEAYEESSFEECLTLSEYNEEDKITNSDGSNTFLNIETLINDSDIKNNDEYSFCEYKEANIYAVDRKYGQSDWHYLGDIINHVVNIEGPIHFESLSRRIVPIFGKGKVGSQIKRTIQHSIENYCSGKVELRGDFCWSSNMESPTVRIPAAGESSRTIEHICVEERAEAMYSVVKKAVGINMDDLFIETARIFGYNRTGGKIQLAMLEAMEYLKESGKIGEVENYIKLAI